MLKRHSANKVAPFSLGVPVVGLSAGMLVLGERISAWQWAGIGLVGAALACVMLGPQIFGGRPALAGRAMLRLGWACKTMVISS